ncbi:substrate-binding domain-containing protein [Intestinibacter sp.]|uniref:substrate-binding domain-containing protein n=1 Tax=Intestinibacter sp. TaxID=1965304 RepID=UPI003F16FC85
MIKKFLTVMLAAVLSISMVACSSNQTSQSSSSSAGEEQKENKAVEEVTLVTTTSLDDTGFLAETLKGFEEANNVKVNVVAKGTGEALELGKSGDADILFVHAKAKEEDFIKGGYGVDRNEIMYNYFVIVGPKDAKDNAEMEDLSAPDVFKYIADNDLTFVSRGDESGTHTKELSIWKEAGIETPEFSNYNEAGKGMGATLQMASEMGAYCLTDIGTFLASKDKLDLEIVKQADDSLKNVYSIVRIANLDPEMEDMTNKLLEYYQSDEVQKEIAEYGVDEYGEALFYTFDESK